MADQRRRPTEADVRHWHATIYAGCAVPSASYVGNFRGAPDHPDLSDYEVGVGPWMPDGWPECVGVWSTEVAAQVAEFFISLDKAFDVLDPVVPPRTRPSSVDVLDEVVGLTAVVHGEWLRIHPFANGNGRTARLLAAHVALRCGLPVFITLKPRPHDIAYMRASKRSMGRPPLFVGDHGEAVSVFAHFLALELLGA